MAAEHSAQNELATNSGNAFQAGSVQGGVHFHAPQAQAFPVPQQLPANDSGFVGRADQLTQLDVVLTEADGASAAVITSVSGTAGVGKTALAIHWAHQVRSRFPDGQMYADLRGYGLAEPAEPVEVLAGFLHALGQGPSVPVGADSMAGLFRTLVSDRRMLIVLDNAHSAEQVRPLLPGSSSCFVLITSRDALPGLVVQHSARRIAVDLLPVEEAIALLRTQLGPRVDAEPEAAQELARQCVYLPLALRVASELAMVRPHVSVVELSTELGEQQRLELFDSTGDPRTSVRAVFSWSYQNLPAETARAFRLMSLHPGRDFDVGAVAALTGVTRQQGQGLANLLQRAHLLRADGSGRLQMHDLLREYATSLASGDDSPDEQLTATRRLFSYYLLGSCRALDLITPQHGRHRPLLPRPTGVIPALNNEDQAYTWLAAERANLFSAGVRIFPGAVELERAILHHNLGLIARHAADIPQALRHFEHAAQRFVGRPTAYALRIWLDQAESLLSAGLWNEAAQRLDDALPLLRAGDDVQDLAEAEALRAVATLLNGDLLAARKHARSAQRRFIGSHQAIWAAIAALIRLRADIRLALKTRTVTRSLARRAHQLADRFGMLGLPDESAAGQMLAVRILIRTGQTQQATEQLRRIPEPRQITPIDHRMLRWLCRAEIAVIHGDHEAALVHARDGLSELSAPGNRMGGLDPVGGSLLHGQELGLLAMQLMLRGDKSTKDAQQIFIWLERTRAQSYRYELPIDDPALADRVADYRQLGHALQRAQFSGGPSETLIRKHTALAQELARRRGATRTNESRHVIAKFSDVAAQLGSRALVTFIASDDKELALAIVDGRSYLVEAGDRASVTEAARRFRADLNALAPDNLPEPVAEVVLISARAQANRLDSELFDAVGQLVGDRELVLVPHGPLFAVAWGALPSLRGRPVVVAPSATMWHAADTATPSASGGPVLVRGPGVPAAVGELDRLRESYPHARFVEGEAATTSAVLDVLKGAALAHMAVHGSIGVENALFSHIKLSDGPLFAHDILGMRTPPGTVVLAANQLAQNQPRPGDEPLGFAGALLAAGVRTVVAAVTRVGIEATAAAMAEYHRLLVTGMPASHALAAMTTEDPFRRPFICVGAGAPAIISPKET